MVNDLKQLLRENVADAPADHLDLRAVVGAGRRAVRRRRRQRRIGAASLLVAGTVLAAVVGASSGDGPREIAGDPPRPDAPTLTLSDAAIGVPGRDYRELASYTNENLDRDNGQYFDGVTEDGLILFRDGPRDDLPARYALMDPESGTKDWLPDPPAGENRTWPVELGRDRLVLLGSDSGSEPTLFAYVYDRGTERWSTHQWPSLPTSTELPRATMGPDGRLYVLDPATQGRVPAGGWPISPGGEADDANATGDTFHLWSVSLTDSTDVRDEHLSVGDVDFTDTAMVWTDSTDGDAGMVHVRDLATGAVRSLDPKAGGRCNLLSFGASGDRIVMGEYCGTYSGGVRDDRVQVLSTNGDQVATIQGSGIDGRLDGTDSDVVTVTAEGDRSGTYVYDLSTGRFLRVSDELSGWGREVGSGAGPDQFFWSTPEGRHGATQHLGTLLP